MPLTDFQATLARLLSKARTPDSYLAGGAALHLHPNSTRYSNDLDYFHDSVERVAAAYNEDSSLLSSNGYQVRLDIKLPGYIRAVVAKKDQSTKVEWAHDTAWRFLPVIEDPLCGYRLHPVDLAINKLLALAGRDEPRDFLDIMFIHENVLSVGGLCWAAVGKDPGFSPSSLLELLKRKGRYHPEDFVRLHLVKQPDLHDLKKKWLAALEEADRLIDIMKNEEPGCLFYSPSIETFVSPLGKPEDAVPHFGRPGGILPQVCS